MLSFLALTQGRGVSFFLVHDVGLKLRAVADMIGPALTHDDFCALCIKDAWCHRFATPALLRLDLIKLSSNIRLLTNGRNLHIVVIEYLARDKLGWLLGTAFVVPDFICDDLTTYLHVLVHDASRVGLCTIVQRSLSAVHG